MQIGLLIVGTVVSAIFCILLLTSGGYDEYVSSLDEKDFPLSGLYTAGFKIFDLFHFQFISNRSNKLRKEAVVLYGNKFGEYYLRVIYAQMITLPFLTVVCSLLVAGMVGESDMFMILIIGLVLSAALFYYFYSNASTKIKKRGERFLSEFPNTISTIALLVNAGMVLREAWEMVAYSGEGELYEQMRTVIEDMKNGVSEIEALHAFSNRCATTEIRKFASMIVQGIEKGNKELSITLKKQSDELWEMKKQNILQQGELASSKLLIPIMLMFVGVLIMVMGPIVTNLGL